MARHPRLDQLFSMLGYGSRHQCEFWIKDGRVQVQGVTKAKVDMRVDPALVSIDQEPLDHPQGLAILLHKPVGYVCSHDDREGPNVYSFLPARWRARSPQVVSVGRLDKDTSGVLLLTDQHSWVQACTSPKKKISKIYDFDFEGELDPEELRKLQAGELILRSESKACMPASFELLKAGHGRLELVEGRYHQVRRMIAACGGHVTRLHRSQFGTLNLQGLAPGEYRLLESSEATLAALTGRT